jgi:hypothetical protein
MENMLMRKASEITRKSLRKVTRFLGKVFIALSIAITILIVFTCQGWTAVEFPERIPLLIIGGSAASLFVFGLILNREN